MDDPLERLRPPDHKSFHDIARERKPPPGGPPPTRIYILILVLIAVAFAVPKLLQTIADTTPGATPPAGGVDATPAAFDVPELESQRRLRELAALVADGEQAPPITDPTMAQMLGIVREGFTDAEFALRINDAVDVNDLLREPSTHRGALVRVFGKAHIVDVTEGVVEAYLDDVASGAVVQLFYPKDDAFDPAADERWLVAEGAFIRPTVYRFTDGVVQRAAVVLARSTAPAEPQERTPEPDVPTDPAQLEAEIQKLVAELIDGDEAPSILHPRMQRIAELIVKGPPVQRVARADLTADRLIQDPAAHRGSVVRFSGRAVNAYSSNQPRFLRDDPDRSVEEVYLWDRATDHTICFFFVNDKSIQWTVEEKPAQAVPVRFINDWVEIEGIFLRTYEFETMRKDATGRNTKRTAAVVFATSVRKTPPPPPPPDSAPFWIVMGIVVAVVAAGLGGLAFFMSRRHGDRTPMRVRMAQERKAKMTEKAPE